MQNDLVSEIPIPISLFFRFDDKSRTYLFRSSFEVDNKVNFRVERVLLVRGKLEPLVQNFVLTA